MNYQINLTPRDKLFFKDARPLGGSSLGNGANWPLPTVFHSAMLSALHQSGYDASWESEHKHLSSKEKLKNNTRFRLGGLKTLGPFPSVNGELYFPVPGDLESSGAVMQPLEYRFDSNLPAPLKYAVANSGAPSKDEVGQWISAAELEKYLNGQSPVTVKSEELFSAESSPGVAISPVTRANKEGQFYQAEYLRLNESFKVDEDDVTSFPVLMTAFATCDARKASGEMTDVLDKFFTVEQHKFIFGGQRGIAYMEAIRNKFQLFSEPDLDSTLIKWVLLSPAIFSNGWLPDWVDGTDGRVKLRERPVRGSMSRKSWRQQLDNAQEIGASLVAAKILKPLAISGWKLDIARDNAGGEPKATRVAVPAGSVYYFSCHNAIEAGKLIKTLHGQVKSSHLGEQGFGLGVCGSWTFQTISG